MARLLSYCAIVVWVASSAGCGSGGLAAANLDGVPDFLVPLAAATEVTLYSIDGTEKNPGKQAPTRNEAFYGYPVLGKVEIKSATQRSEIVLALKRGTENLDHGFANCFWPRHAFRVKSGGKTVDYVICFECSWIKVFIDQQTENVVTNEHAQDTINRILKHAGIEIAP